MSDPSVSRIPVTCNKDCGGECPLLAVVRDGRVVKIAHNPAAPVELAGCSRGARLHKVLYAPDRLKAPLLRTGPRGLGRFREGSWSEALDLVAERLTAIKARYGNAAILHLGGSGAPRGALHNTKYLTMRFLALFGGYTATLDNYSVAAADYATPYVLGTTMAGIDAATLAFSKLIVLWGANTSDTRLGSETHARLRQARAQGADIVVIDPRRTSTARDLDAEWIPVRPGTDTAFMLAVLYVLLREDMVDRPFVDRYSVGFEALERYVLGTEDGQPKTPEWAAALCGMPPDRIAGFACRYGQSHPAALIPGLSIQRTVGGEEAIRMSIALQVATGNLGALGGSSGALAWGKLPSPRVGRIGVPANPCSAAIPVVRWPDAILEGTAGGYDSDIKAVYNVGGNFVGQGSDVRKSIRAFEKLEFAVCHDLFLTPTARYCDVVLPVTSPLEREDIIIAIGGNYLLYSGQAVPPCPGVKNDYDIFCELASRLGFLAEFSVGRTAAEWLEHFMDESEISDRQAFRQAGLYFGAHQMRVGLSDFVADPRAHPLSTPSGRVEIASEAYAATGFSAFPTCRILPDNAEYPLRLITPHPRDRVHSQGGNLSASPGRDRHALSIHPYDAQARGIVDGQCVSIRSVQGTSLCVARVTGDIMSGVVSLDEGVWPQLDADGIDHAGSANVLTPTEPTRPSQGTRTHAVLVEVMLAPATDS